MAAVCVAVISKQVGFWRRYRVRFYDDCGLLVAMQNFPLYLRSASPQNEADLQFQYLVHASIDVVEEKGEPSYGREGGECRWRPTPRSGLSAVSTLGTPKAGQDPREHYLGLLYPSEQYKV